MPGSLGIATTVCVSVLPDTCPVCGGPYQGGRSTSRDPVEATRYRCPICRWHAYLRPAPSDDLPPISTNAIGGFAMCEECGIPFQRRESGGGRTQRFCTQIHAMRHWRRAVRSD